MSTDPTPVRDGAPSTEPPSPVADWHPARRQFTRRRILETCRRAGLEPERYLTREPAEARNGLR